MLETSARLLSLLSLLQTPREWTGTELAARLEVTTRTVRNDVDRLRSLGYPVHATRGSAGGYRLGAGADLPPLLLDDEEAVAVALGLRNATTGSIAGIEESALRALAKLEQVLPSRLRRRVNTLAQYTISIPPDRGGPRVEPSMLSSITAAARDRERLRFDYTTHDGQALRREAEPHRLVSWGRRWYLVAWDVARADWRTYRVDRMTLATPNGARFSPRPPPADDLARYVSQRVTAAWYSVTARVIVHAPAALVAERLPAAVGPVEALDEHRCVVSTGSDSVQMLALWLGALEADFEVSDSPELAERFAALADRYARAAAASIPTSATAATTTTTTTTTTE
ncbi:WYL domain-containing protein [Jatrophihabitans telluris]|uniref:WYL domain-containing protein n=1 Tax=Jatrophihabitans telluris TaxID=2038343 RepID=A0ABY4QZU1_9ACTN|nr:WYL domain-containing protein [Jatrophihabitans telluris]UQX88396.1 WYL domain-containing protein [Jatrophihabitans telluris]